MSSIMTNKPVSFVTAPTPGLGAHFFPKRFDELIYDHGYEAYLDRALRCPCCDKATGQPSVSCQNCLGRGWFFVDRRYTRIVAQSMTNLKRYEEWSQVNKGTAKLTVRGTDKLGFMDRVVLLELEGHYSELLFPFEYNEELICYPIYEPLEVTDIYLYLGDGSKLLPIPAELYKIEGNKITFDNSLLEYASPGDMNDRSLGLTISIRYSYHPVYHVVDINRELMKVRDKNCAYTEEVLTQMPINVIARKAHYIFENQKFGENLFDNSL